MKKIITLFCFFIISTSYAQLIAIDDVVVGRSDNPGIATAISGRVFQNDYFNGAPITFANRNNFTFTEIVPDPTGRTVFLPALQYAQILPNTPPGIYYITYQVCENANPTNCDTAEIEIRVFPSTVSAGSGSSEMTITSTPGTVINSGNVSITTAGCVDLNTGTISPITLSAEYTEIGTSNVYGVRSIPMNPPFSWAETAADTPLEDDDEWVGPLSIAFNFEFYQNNYTQCMLSTNGAVSFDLASATPGLSHYWTPAAGALIPNNTDACLRNGNIFGAVHDMYPLPHPGGGGGAPILAGDYRTTYSVKGEAPFRAFVFTFFNVGQFGNSCWGSARTSQMIILYETTNIIETYIFQKDVCASWAGGRAAIGIQNNAGTAGISPPGRNTGVWNIPYTAPEAYQFYPNGTTITSFEWLDENGVVLGTDPTGLTIVPTQTTTYIAQVTYTHNGVETVAYKPITVVVPPTPIVTVATSDDLCDSGDAVFTITGAENDIVEYQINGGPILTATLDATGEEVITITGVTTTQTITLLSANNYNSVCGGPMSLSATVTVNASPVVDEPADLTACNDYTLPALTVGDYYTATGGPGGTGTLLNAGDVITTTQDIFVYAETGTIPNCFDEHMFTVTIDTCTLAVNVAAVSICSDAGADVTLTAIPSPTVPVGAYSYSWNVQGDATVISAIDVLLLSPPPVATTTYEVTLTDDGLTAPNNTVTNTVTVTVLPAENAAFTTTAGCTGGTMTITGDTGGTFAFNPAPTDGATINATTGTITGATPGATYTVEYTTGGPCPAVSIENITILPAEDASFTTTPTCDGGTMTITGTTGGTFAFNPVPTDGATIDPTTGTVIGGTSGVTYTIEYTTGGACSETSTQTVTVITVADPSFTTTATCDGGTVSITGDTGGTFALNPLPTDGATIDPGTGTITGGTPLATYTIEYTIGGSCGASSTETVTVLPAENPAFTTTATCDGGTAAITGDTGGAFAFNPAPTDTATINTATGTVTGGTPGATYTIEYTTAGPCPATSVQNVTVLPAEDASFTTTATCDGGTVTITGNLGGIFAFNPVSGDGATIDPNTGTVTGGTSGSTYTVEYTTAGPCTATSTQTVTVILVDDASFTTTPDCYGATATITGDTGGTFAFNPAPTDGATIDPTTGTIAGGTPGTTYSIEYTTAGACISSSIETVTTHSLPVVVVPTPLFVCDDNIPDGETEMDLTVKNNEISGGNTNYIVTYYNSEAAADLGTPQVMPSATNYIGNNNEVVWVRVEDATTGCYDTTSLTLNVVEAPAANIPPDLHYCDPNNDGYGVFDLDSNIPLITADPALVVTFHQTYQNASDNVEPLSSPYNNVFIDQQEIYVRVDYDGATTDCPTIISFFIYVDKTPAIELNPEPIVLCDNDGTADGMTPFNLTLSNTEILNGLSPLDYTVTYYLDQAGAEMGITSPSYITTPGAFTNTVAPNQTIWVRVENNTTNCITVTSLDLIVNPLPVPVTTTQALSYEICDDTINNDGYAIFDLTVQDNIITGGNSNWTVNYFETMADVSANNPIPDYTAYANTAIGGFPHNPQTIFVTVSSTANGVDCYALSTLTLIVNPVPTPNPVLPNLELCDDTNSGDLEEAFDLTLNEGVMMTAYNETITYHTTMADAESGANTIPDPAAYVSQSRTIYVRVTNTGDPAIPTDNGTGCYTIVSFEIVVNPLPVATPVDDILACELNTDGFYTFDLTIQNDGLLNGQPEPNFVVSYYTTLAAAQLGTGAIANPSAYTNMMDPANPGQAVNPQEIFVNITNTITGCDVATVSFFIEVQEDAQVNPNYNTFALCDDNMEFDGNPSNDTVAFDLLSQNTILLNGQDPINYIVTYYESEVDAEAMDNAIDTSSPYVNTSNPQIIWVRIDNDTNANSICYDVKPLTLQVDPIPAFDLKDVYTICVDLNGTEVIGAPLMDTGLSSTLYTFEWIEDGDPTVVLSTDSSYMPTVEGNYTVIVTDNNNLCVSSDTALVQLSSPPNITATVTTQAFAGSHTIEVTATGTGAAIFEFSIDNGPWLSNEPNGNTYTFSNVPFGEHVIQARDINGCGLASDSVLVMDYPLFFTPNNDGYNDTWQIFGIQNQYDAKIFIYDRYGKLLKQLNPTGPGWDGTYNGELMPSNDYWFTIDYRELGESEGSQKQFKAHFSLKR